MFRLFEHRLGHYLFLVAVAAVLFLPNLGAPRLWDIDEGNNAEAAREMLESGNWVVPTFNFRLRGDKPALLYWLQIAAYETFGINEFSARLPSALAALLATLLTYELGRRMFGASAGLLAGLVLASTISFCASAHFANPDALLNACTVLTLLIFWRGFSSGGRGWFVPAGISAGIAVLAKGPVGLVLPGAVIVIFLLWSRQLRLLLDRRLLLGIVVFSQVAGPWYGWVSADTKGEFARQFFLTHNAGRFLDPMENHSGPIYYYVVALGLGFLPWSIFLPLAVHHVFRTLRNARHLPAADAQQSAVSSQQSALRFLLCWVALYFLFFSISGTKLPNYILPLYPPLAILTASLLDQWRRNLIQIPGWTLKACLACLMLLGVGTTVGFLIAGGAIEASFVRGRHFAGLGNWAFLGVVPLLGAVGVGWALRRERRDAALALFCTTAVLFVGTLAGWGGAGLNAYKAPEPLAGAIRAGQSEPDIRVGCYGYFQPSLVFYCQREVFQLTEEDRALDFLRCPLQVFLLVPSQVWSRLEARMNSPYRLLARHHDLYKNCDVVVVTNK